MEQARALINFVRSLIAVLVLSIISCASAALSLNPPDVFFTNVADRLLQQQLGMRLTQIQIAPTNQYDAAVHRILQVTANIYDATSTNEFPSVFRPLFNVMNNGVFLAGFTNDNSASTLQSWLDSNPYGIPMVIAARKGFPNFNEFTLRTDVLMQRKLQLTRPSIVPGTRPDGTNQMYTLSLSNYFGVEGWNSSAQPYPRPVTLMVSNFATLSMTNGFGLQTNAMAAYSAITNIPANSWHEGGPFPSQAFVIALNTNGVFLSNAVYRFAENRFANSGTNAFESFTGFPLPYWVFTISNRLTYALMDGNRIIDFVLLNATRSADLYHDLVATDPYQGLAGVSAVLEQVWSTNRFWGTGPTDGIWQQLDISLGHLQTVNSDWRTLGLNTTVNESQKNSLIDSFRSFCGLPPLYGTFVTNNALQMQAPFNPAAKLTMLNTWQVNDPLVHYHSADFNLFRPVLLFLRPAEPSTNILPSSLGLLNDCYSPWGGNPQKAFDPDAFYRAITDPGVYQSDNWNFPTNEALSPRWLGRVHRGTPWQTIYLKADVAPWNVWTNQSRSLATNQNGQLYSPTHPTNDWRMVELLASLLNTNDVRTLRSINETNFNSWRATFAGLTALSNTVANPQLDSLITFETNVIAAGAPQLVTILDRIDRSRTVRRGEYFSAFADLLALPELSSASPWLNLDPNQQNFGLIDEAYEILPSQLLSLIRADPVGTATRSGGATQLTFTTFDGYAHRLEATTNLVTWTTVSEPHYSTNGVLSVSLPIGVDLKFFRAVLLP